MAKEEHGEGLAARDPSERVSFRATQSELEVFDAEWRMRGFANRSQALNAVLRGRCGFLDVSRDLVAEFCASWRQAKDVSDAGLALAKAVHRRKLDVLEVDRAVLIKLLDLAQSMSRELGRMKDAAQAQRRQEWPKMEEGEGPDGEGPEDSRRAAAASLSSLRRSDLKLNPQSLPLGEPRTRLEIHPNFALSRKAGNG